MKHKSTLTNEELIHAIFALDATKRGRSPSSAVISELTMSKIDGSLNAKPILHSADIYEALEKMLNHQSNPDALGIVIDTSGWAAPIAPDGTIEGAPSEHPSRRRVTLTLVVTDNGVASVLMFDGDDDPVYDYGDASGALNEAVLSAWQMYKL